MQVSIDFADNVFSAIRKSPDEFVQEMRLAAAIKWYELEMISQSKASEIANVSRQEFITALNRYNVSPVQQSIDDLIKELDLD